MDNKFQVKYTVESLDGKIESWLSTLTDFAESRIDHVILAEIKKIWTHHPLSRYGDFELDRDHEKIKFITSDRNLITRFSFGPGKNDFEFREMVEWRKIAYKPISTAYARVEVYAVSGDLLNKRKDIQFSVVNALPENFYVKLAESSISSIVFLLNEFYPELNKMKI